MKQFACMCLVGLIGVGNVQAQLIGSTTMADRKLLTALAEITPIPPAEQTPVLMIGDSMMRLLGSAMEKELAQKQGIVASSFSSIGTGLARLDAFDWMQKMTELLTERKPMVVVVSLGANDRQVIVSGDGSKLLVGSKEWESEYARRVTQFMDMLQGGGVKHVIWLTLPDMKDPGQQAYAVRVNKIFADIAATHAQVKVFETAPVLAAKAGRFVSYVMGSDGAIVTVRDPDGVHLSTDGARRLAQALVLTYWKTEKAR